MVCTSTIKHVENLISSWSDLFPQFDYIYFTREASYLKYLILLKGTTTKAAGLVAGCPQGDGIPVGMYVMEGTRILYQTETFKSVDNLTTAFESKIIPLLTKENMIFS